MNVIRRMLRVLAVTAVILVGLAGLAAASVETRWFKDWLRGYIVREASQYVNGELSIGRLGGNLFSGVQLEDIRLTLDGRDVATVQSIALHYSIRELVSKGLEIDQIALAAPTLYVSRGADGWSVSNVVKKEQSEADRQGPGRPITIRDIGISGGAVVFSGNDGIDGVNVPKRIDRLDAKLTFAYEPIHYTVHVDHVSFRAEDPGVSLNALSGDVAVRDETVFLQKVSLRTAQTSVSIDGAVERYLSNPTARLVVSSDKVSLPELARIVPALNGITQEPAFELKLDGPMDAMRTHVNARSAAGSVLADLTLGYGSTHASVAGSLRVKDIDLAAWLNRADLRSQLTGELTMELRSIVPVRPQDVQGRVRLITPHVAAAGYAADQIEANASFQGGRITIDGRLAAYGARATAKGALWLPANGSSTTSLSTLAVRYDFNGRLDRLNLERIRYPSSLPRAATNVNAGYHVRGTRDRVDAGIRFAASSLGSARILEGGRADFTLDRGSLGYDANLEVADVNPREVGRTLRVAALDDSRYEGSIAGRALVHGSGTRLDDLDVAGGVTVGNSHLAGAQLSWVTLAGSVRDGAAHVVVSGSAADLNPRSFGASTAPDGRIAGTFDVDATLGDIPRGFDIDRLGATVRADLEPSTVGSLKVDEATISGVYANSAADIEQLTVNGDDVHVEASGRLSLGHDRSSNLQFAADSSQLKTIGDVAGIPLTGIGKVSGTVTGDRDALNIAGSLTGDGVSYGDTQALTLNTDYSANVPDLTPAQATVHTTNHATFVVAGGQHINQLDATADYDRQQITFDATAKQPKRSAAATGMLVLLPDRQEVRLQHLSLQTEGQEWRNATDKTAVIDYGHDAIAVKDLVLENGTQRITVDGAVGGEDDGLKTTLTDVDLAAVDALLLRPPQFSGRLNGSAVVSGSREQPQVKAELSVTQGGFRNFRYDELKATVDYRPTGVELDARLQQNANASVSAKGFVPRALYDPDSSDGASRPVDVRLESTGIDLGIAQGFTTAVTDARGAVEADVRITGAADNPQASGAIGITDGAFTVQPTGAKYSAITGRVEFRGDRIEIADMRAQDNDKDVAFVSGGLSLRSRNVSDVEIDVHTDRFDILDNKLGQLSLDSDLRLTGDLTRPRIEGNLSVGTGRLEVDRILALIGSSAYNVKETAYEEPLEPATDASSTAAVPGGLFGAMQIDVYVDVPDDLVVRASNLRAPGSTVGLGAMNLTLGGDLRAQKDRGGAVKLTGEVNTVRGTYEFQGRKFEILRDGTVRFAGLEEIDPRLDIRAQRTIQGVDANVDIQGTLERPRIKLSSVPPLEQADILALIVFNQPINQLGEGQQVSLSQRAASLAEGAVAGELAGALGKALNLDTFEIQTASDSSNSVQVTAGQQLGQHAFVKLQQGIGDESQTNFVFEYQFLNWLRLESNFLVGNSIQQALFQRVQDTGADLVVQLPRKKRKK